MANQIELHDDSDDFFVIQLMDKKTKVKLDPVEVFMKIKEFKLDESKEMTVEQLVQTKKVFQLPESTSGLNVTRVLDAFMNWSKELEKKLTLKQNLPVATVPVS